MAPMMTTGAGVYRVIGGGGGYTGPGDVVSGAYAWYGLRGYTAAYSTGSNPGLILVDQAGANQVTINILANGRLDVASISAWVTANSVSTIKVKQMHDQTGNSRHVLQATLANMPVLNLTGFGSLPAVVITAASSHGLTTSGTFTVSQPITYSIVSNRTSSSSGQDMAGFAAENFLFTNNATNRLTIYTGTVSTPNVTVSDTAWHALQGVVNGASSNIYVDGSANASTAGTGGATTRQIFIAGPPSISNAWGGSVAEFGIWNSAFNSTQAGDVNTNQHGANGHNF